MYLKHCIQTVEFSEFLGGLDLACSMEYNGSKLYKYIELLVSFGLSILPNAVFHYKQRKACEHFDKKTSELVRLDTEPAETDSPHIVAIRVDRQVILISS